MGPVGAPFAAEDLDSDDGVVCKKGMDGGQNKR